MKYYNKNIDEVLLELNTKESGLNSGEVSKRIEEYGPNELQKKKQKSTFKIFLEQIISPLEIVLIFAAILSFFIGEYIDASIMIIIILVDVIIGTVEEKKALKSSENLMSMIEQETLVLRDRKEYLIDSKDLVPGDIVLLESGTRITVDGRVIESQNLEVDESSLTGESIEVSKISDKISKNVGIAEQKNMVFAGTIVISGRAKVVVTGTGLNTEIGKVAKHINEMKDEKTPLIIKTEKFIKYLSFVLVALSIILCVLLSLKGYKPDYILISVIALAVSALPEGLSLAITMVLTIGSNRLSKKGVIVKDLNSVEALGSCTVIATDKTGTLTLNEQTAKKILLKDGSEYDVDGVGYNYDGTVKPIGDSELKNAYDIAYLGALNNEASLVKENNDYDYFGDNIDVAFLALAAKLGIKEKPEAIHYIPYESEKKYSGAYYKKKDELFVTIKGSAEKLKDFTKDKKLMEDEKRLVEEGYRTIAVLSGKVKDKKEESIKNLEYIGVIGFTDPIREDAKESILKCEKSHIKVIMITGDHPTTAYLIGKELNICDKKEDVVTSVDLETARRGGQKKFDKFISSHRVFARVTPLDKLDIVESLKRQDEFVAVTGDGVNDASALKSANIGVAMGKGTDAAKETSDMILLNNSFTSIVKGIEEGRTCYANIRKIALFLLSCGLAEVLFFIYAILFDFPMPLIAIQLLWLNVVTDGLQDIALSFEEKEDSIMKEKPRNSKSSLFTKDLISEIVVLGLSISIIVFGLWFYLQKHGYTLEQSRSYIMMLMVFIQNINVLNCVSEKGSVFKHNYLKNKLLLGTIIICILIQIFISNNSYFANIFGITSISFIRIVGIFLLSLLIIVVDEIYKIIVRKNAMVK